MTPQISAFYDKETFTLTYIVSDPKSRDAVVIDPVWNYEPASSVLSLESTTQIISHLAANRLNLRAILETHAHADHISGAQPLKRQFPDVPLLIGNQITKVQTVFREIFNLSADFPTNGSQFTYLLDNEEVFEAGSVPIKALFTPGHTPACCSYLIGDCVFTGDALFMPDYGTGRCDFPGGSAKDLYRSISAILYSLPTTTRTFTGHDYQPNGRPVAWESTIAAQIKGNIHLNEKTTEAEFIRFRTERDKTLSAPKLLLPSIQLNISAGNLPVQMANGRRYLQIPIGEKT